MFEKEVFQFKVPMTNIHYYGYSIYKDSIILKTIYFDSAGSGMTEEQANIEADLELAKLESVTD